MSQAKIYVIFAFLAVTNSLIVGKKLYFVDTELSQLITCNRRESFQNIENCLKASINSMKQYLAEGVPNLEIPSHEPYLAGNYEYNSRKQYFNGYVALTDPTTHGLTNFTLNKVRVNTHVSLIKLEAYFPYIRFFAMYDIDAVIFSEVVQKGDHLLRMEITGTSINATIHGEYYVDSSNNEEYFRVIDVPVELKVNDIIIYLNNNKQPDRLLGSINHHLAHDKKKVMHEIMPKIRTFASKHIRSIANKIYSNIPMRLLMPNSFSLLV